MVKNITRTAVVPGYYLVCYNLHISVYHTIFAVVPGYYLVCYNKKERMVTSEAAVVPGYYLVCYNDYVFRLFTEKL